MLWGMGASWGQPHRLLQGPHVEGSESYQSCGCTRTGRPEAAADSLGPQTSNLENGGWGAYGKHQDSRTRKRPPLFFIPK